MDPSEKKRPRKDDDDNLTGDIGRFRCDCCGNVISDNHIQNTPCGHIVCLLCVVKSNMKRGANPTYFCCQCQVESCTQTFTTSCQYFNRGVPGEIIISVVELGKDVIPCILSFLDLKEIMQKRIVCKRWKEAARKTIVPLTDFRVYSLDSYNAMRVMTTELPYLQQIMIGTLGYEHKYNDGEDPDEGRVDRTSDWTTHDIEILSNFSKLRRLKISNEPLPVSGMNGRYPFLFNSFPLLQKLSIQYCRFLKWDLGMLAGMPLLKELECFCNENLTSSISSLGVLRDNLEKVEIFSCENIEGNFMDLADFPRLRELVLEDTAVTGDIRDIGENDFSSLERLDLPKGVYGGRGYKLQRIFDAPDLIRAVYLLKKQRPALKMTDWFATLSGDSPDRYESVDNDYDTPPFYIHFVIAASRIGYRWETYRGNPCEVNWLDPEPERDSSDYVKYIAELQKMNDDYQVGIYRGFHQPPTEEDYHSIWEGNVEEIDE